MSKLNAFVGHSFSPEDEEVVNKILKHLTEISKFDANFSWDHALSAKPEELSKKVLTLIKDKNLFIGICTKKEKVTTEDKINKAVFSTNKVMIKNEDLEWKTSDWVIQEIGLAVGKGMDIILLLEEGTRNPGGLAGNIEYISFNRESSTNSFDKISEMVRALLSKKTKKDISSIKKIPKDNNESKEEGIEDDENIDDAKKDTTEEYVPNSDWDKIRYRMALFHFVYNNDSEGEKTILDAHLENIDKFDKDESAAWEGVREHVLIAAGKEGSFDKLRKLGEKHPQISEIQKSIGLVYRDYEEYEKSGEIFLKASSIEQEDSEKLHLLGLSAKSYAKTTNKFQLLKVISELKMLSNELPNSEKQLLKVIAEVAETQKDDITYTACLERLLSITPDDISLRFDLAYKYSNTDETKLSLFHYLRIPQSQRSHMAWNNLGVAYDELGFNIKSVESYYKSKENEGTLPVSNLANKLLNEGFSGQAKELLDTAKKAVGYHKNIDASLVKITDKTSEEETSIKEIKAETKTSQEFYCEYGHAMTKNDILNLVGTWSCKDSKIDIEIKDNLLTGNGVHEEIKLGGEKTTHELNFEVNMNGHSGKGIVKKKKIEDKGTEKLTSVLSNYMSNDNIFITFSDDLTNLKVVRKEGNNSNELSFQEFIKEQ